MAKNQKVTLDYIKIKSVSPSLKNELKSIAKNLDVDLSSFLKPKLREIANSYPMEMRKYKD